MTRREQRSVEAYERFGQAVDGPMTVLTVVWLPVLIVPLVAHLSPTVSEALDGADYTFWALFVIEYLVKLALAPSRRLFVRSHVLDLVVIAVPFLRPLRALRVLRLLRFSTVAGQALRRSRRMLTEHGLHYVMLAATVLVFAGAAAVLGFDHNAHGSNIHSYGDALWWALVTVTTVGYGDHYPVTAAGRGVALVLMLVGIGLIGVITANVAAFFVTKTDAEDRRRLSAIEGRLEHIESLLTSIAVQTASSADLATNGSEHNSPESLPPATLT